MIKMQKKQFAALLIAVVAVSSLLTFGGLYLYADSADRTVVSKDKYEQMEKISDRYAKLYIIQERINSDFLWETDPDEQMEVLYKSLLASLDDEYSIYMDKDEYAKWTSYIQGQFTGIGVVFTQNENNEFEITELIKDGPAEAAGLMAGDIISSVDGKIYETSDEMRDAMRGKEGTSVKLTYLRNGKEKEADIVRAVVEEESVYGKILDNNLGYIRISSFEKNTAEQFKTELSAMENKGVGGVVIDLRNNPGGLMEAGIDIADMLLPECTITHTEDRKGEKKYYNSDEKCTKLKYVLLVNENTASSSEIIAAAVKDNKGGQVAGTKTYGKGIIQTTMELTDHTAVKLTTMQYFSPANKKIHKAGVTPDVIVELPANAKTDIQLEKALELLQ